MMTRTQHMLALTRHRVRRFKDKEDGAIVAFSVFFILILLLIGGIGIDLMRFEYTRTSLQSTLDRAVLAAADLDQRLDPRFVVEDYFAKSNLSQHLRSITVDQGISHKQVDATAEVAMPTQLMKMAGVDTLAARAAGSARESIGKVEISLILDVSGSMSRNSRLVNLKDAAKDFVDMVLTNNETDDVSISIVPYSEQVSLGESLMDEYNVTNQHNYSHCIDFLADEFNSTDISTTFEWQRTAHFDPWAHPGWYGYNQVNIDSGQTLTYPVCPTDDYNDILPLSNDADVLKDRIDDLRADGNTSIDLGMKWGTALLDPSAQPVVNGLINKGEVDSVFSGRPYAYDVGSTLKIAIVMTDGENTDQHYILPPYREGLAPMWRHASGKYSLKSGSYWYYPHNNSWHNEPYKDGTGNSSNQMTYQEVFARMPMAWNAYENWAEIEGNWTAYNHWYKNLMGVHNANWKDQRLDRICKAAKDKGIIVFTIAFEAPRSGQRVLEKCASSDGHYFDADGLDISDAFVAIASSISKLRLVQ